MPCYVTDEGWFLLFVHIPKTGGTSVEAALRPHCTEFLYDRGFHSERLRFSRCSAQHFHWAALQALFPNDFFSLKFAVVRDPVARIVSEYRFRQGLRPRSRRNTRPPGSGREPEGFGPWLRYAFDLYRKAPYAFDNHIRPQVAFVADGVEVFRLEDGLDPCFARLSEHLGIDITPPPRPLQTSKTDPVTPGDDDIALIREFYAADYQAFGYS